MTRLLSSLPVGTLVKDMNSIYKGKSIIFRIAAKNHSGYPSNSVTLLVQSIDTFKAFDAKEPTNPITLVHQSGNNRYAYSNIRKWLNSDKSNWYTPQHSYDQPPNSSHVIENPYDTESGFLSNFSDSFKYNILPTNITVAKSVAVGGGSEVLQDKLFLLSASEVGFANENNIAEGTKLENFNYGTKIGYDTSGPKYWWLRSPTHALEGGAKIVDIDGLLTADWASRGDFGVRPALNIPSDIMVSESADFDGVYILLFNTAPTATQTLPNQSTQLGTNKTVNLSPYFSDADGDAITYTAASSNPGIGTVTVSGSTLTLTPKVLGSTTITVTANDGKGGTKSTTFTFSVVNSAPTVSLTAPSANQTLYENDVFNLAGTVSDGDSGNSVTVRYQINANTTRAIKAFVSNGLTAEAFSQTLTFKSGSLYDGDTLIAGNLSDGVAHTLKVWATDDQGGTSVIAERAFYAVPNRAPSLTVNAPVIAGNIDSDKFTVNGSYNDADSNTTIVKYRINGGNSVQVASGTSGVFDFEVSFAQLTEGLNTIVVEAVDSYGAKTSKTIKLNKNVVSTGQLRSTARYKILPPTNTAKAVLLWIERDKNLDIDVAISMTMAGEAELFVPLTATESVPIANGSTTYEDTFFYEAASAKDNIIVQIDMTRQSVEVNDKITLISGVLE